MIMVYDNGNIYSGGIMNDVQHGTGTMTSVYGSYTGEWRNGSISGNGILWCKPSGNIYKGVWKRDVTHSATKWPNDYLLNGVIIYANGVRKIIGNSSYYIASNGKCSKSYLIALIRSKLYLSKQQNYVYMKLKTI